MGKDQELLQSVKDQDVTSIHRILSKNRTSKAKLIGGSKKLNVNFQDSDGMAALHQAALVGNVDIMKLLLDSGAAVDIRDSKGMRPLHYAAWQGKEEPVSVLLKWGAGTNEPALDGETPLHLACQHGHYEVVNLMLYHHGNPTIYNNHWKTPLDLACEFGRYRVADLLVNSKLCDALLMEHPEDMIDNNRTTCLHLAAKNGHSDIIKLLLHAGVNINRQTLQGTCLHEAALCGKIDVVKLLLDCGIDVNKPNSYDQTALDIVNKFTTSRAAKELKQLLKDPFKPKSKSKASYAVPARAVKQFSNPYDTNALAFQEGDFINVLEQGADGIWKGYVMHDGQMARTGYFPASAVVLVDSAVVASGMPGRGGRQVLPPQVPPDVIHRNQPPPSYTSLHPDHHHRGPLHAPHYNTVGQDEGFPPPPSPLVPPKSPNRVNTGQHIVDNNYTKPSPFKDADRDSGISPQQGFPPHGFPSIHTYPGHERSPTTPEQQGGGDWYGRHLTDTDGRSASPSRDSPGSSNRNSAASTGSGGSYLGGGQYVNIQITAQHRLSGQSYESGVSSRQSYHSGSSSSLGSLDRLEESGYSSTVNVHELFQAGLSQDSEVLRAWLADLHFEEYYNLFVQAGYDMPTISRMTPEDLTAIGITKPAHRKRLKSEISKLHIHDGIPDHKPHDVGDWLRLLNLDIYYDTLTSQGYSNIEYVTDITWEDLEEIGIKKLGHQKKIMLAIDRLKRIQSGSRRLSTLERRSSSELLEPASSYPTPKWLQGDPGAPPSSPGLPPHYATQDMFAKPKRSPSGESIPSMSGPLSSYSQQGGSKSNLVYQPDVVAIQVNRPSPARTQSQEDGDGGGGSPAHNFQSFHGPLTHHGESSMRGSSEVVGGYDEADRGGGGLSSSSDTDTDSSTLKRPSAMVSPRISSRPKPIAKIIAKTKRASRDVSGSSLVSCGEVIKVESPNVDDLLVGVGYSGTLGRKSSFTKPEPIYDTPSSDMGPPSPSLITAVHQSPVASRSSSANSTPTGTPQHYASPMARSGGGASTPTGLGGRKAPPPPPKRTNSIKSDGPGPYVAAQRAAGGGGGECSQSPSSPALQPPPAFATCVKDLTDRFQDAAPTENPSPQIHHPQQQQQQHQQQHYQQPQHQHHQQQQQQPQLQGARPPVSLRPGRVAVDTRAKDDGRRDSSSSDISLPEAPGDYTPPQEEDFPPPPPPISAPTPTRAFSADVDGSGANPLTEVIERLERQGGGASSNLDGSSSGFRRNESSCSLDSTTSVSSTDLNALPFANENVGTIKQRNPSSKPSIINVSAGGEDSEGADRNVELNSSMFEDNTGTIKRKPSSSSSNASSSSSTAAQPMAQVQPLQRGAESRKVPPPTPTRRESMCAADGQSAAEAGPVTDASGDVLNDIGNMLQDLTDELDAMLEFELQ